MSAVAGSFLGAKFNFSGQFEGDFDHNLKTAQFSVANFVFFSLRGTFHRTDRD
jgi:hypothetical protein